MQTELSNTLKRRKPVAIIDPPKYQYPIALDANKTDISAFESIKPINVNRTMTVVSSIKFPEDVNINISRNIKATPNDESMINDAKPKFTLPRKILEFPVSVNGIELEKIPNTNEVAAAPLLFQSLSPKMKTAVQLSTETPSAQISASSIEPPSLPIRQPPNQFNTAGPKKLSVPNETTTNRKLFITHGKPNFVAPSKTTRTHTGSKETVGNSLNAKIKLLKAQGSNDDARFFVLPHRITERNAIFEKPYPFNNSANTIKTLKQKNMNHPSTNNSNQSNQALYYVRSSNDSKGSKLKSPNYKEPLKPYSDSSNDTGHLSQLSQPPCINKSAVDQQLSAQTTSKNVPIGRNTITSNTVNYEQKTVVSFSKELNDSPNRYPEHVRVTKKVTSNAKTTTSFSRQEEIFDNIRFSINEQSQVIHKLKH